MPSQNITKVPQVIKCCDCGAWVGFIYPTGSYEDQGSMSMPIYCVECMRRINMVLCALGRGPTVPEFYKPGDIKTMGEIHGKASLWYRNTERNLLMHWKFDGELDGKDVV